MKKLLYIILLSSIIFAGNLDILLKKYQKASELSRITKIDTAGFVYIFTREDLEKMQSYSLKDVLSLIPGLNFVYTPNYTPLFTVTSSSYLTQTAIRLYINDHDLTSSSFGSAMLIWGEMPIELFDHIEVYKAASSIEFGSETAPVIIKCYTKLAKREVGNKLRSTFDTHGSSSLDGYNAHLFDKSTLFIYAQGQNYKAHTTYRDGYPIKRNKNDFFFYANYKNDFLTLQSGYINLNRDPFLGHGKAFHPTGGGLDAYHTFIDLTTTLANTDIALSFDNLSYDRVYKDRDGIFTYDPNASRNSKYVQRYNITFTDTIFGLKVKKRWNFKDFSLIGGGLYKYKLYHQKGRFDSRFNRSHNALNLVSLYAEGRYNVDPSLQLFLMTKTDWYFYDKAISTKKKAIFKVGAIKTYKQFKFKTFFQKSYIPIEFFKLYLANNLPLKANPSLKFPTRKAITLEGSYHNGQQNINLRLGRLLAKNQYLYSHTLKTYVNNDRSITYYFYELDYTYNFDFDNKILCNITRYFNNVGTFSPDTQIFLRLFNHIHKFDIYNEIVYKNGYNRRNVHYDASTNYTAAIKYHVTSDLSIGIRGENIFSTGDKIYDPILKQISYPVFEHRFIANLEWTF